nr:MAG TPA: hypothetical protein [Bacteriophage sp.]
MLLFYVADIIPFYISDDVVYLSISAMLISLYLMILIHLYLWHNYFFKKMFVE